MAEFGKTPTVQTLANEIEIVDLYNSVSKNLNEREIKIQTTGGNYTLFPTHQGFEVIWKSLTYHKNLEVTNNQYGCYETKDCTKGVKTKIATELIRLAGLGLATV